MNKLHSFFSFTLTALFIAGCGLVQSPTPPDMTAAEQILPIVPGYDIVETDSLKTHLSTLTAGGKSILEQQPELLHAVEGVETVVSCYQDLGAVRAQIYSETANPVASGVIAVADKSVLLNPLNFLGCINNIPTPPADSTNSFTGESLTLEPCVNSYSITKDGHDLLVLYAGTTAETCAAFCTYTEGCTATP